jgi:hypothetical protein
MMEAIKNIDIGYNGGTVNKSRRYWFYSTKPVYSLYDLFFLLIKNFIPQVVFLCEKETIFNLTHHREYDVDGY